MSRLISEILNAPEPRFNHTLHAWEQMSGRTGHDVRLISDIVQKRKKVLKALKLDERDTTPQELFHALCYRAVLSNEALTTELKITDTDTPEEIIEKIVNFIDTLTIKRDIWTIKHTVIKQLLKKQPPKKLLKVMGLRSIDSVLKRTSAPELLTLSFQLETEEWANKMRAQYKKLKPTDFQTYTSSICVIEKARVEKLHNGGYKSSRVVVPNYEIGTIVVVPPVARFNMDVLAVTMALLQTLYDLRAYSSYFRLISVKPHFGVKLHKAVQHGLPGKIHDLEIGWTVLQRHFTESAASFESVEQPHLQYDDVILISPIEALGEVVPEIRFWSDNGHVFMLDSRKPISMHLMDVITNASNKLPYDQSVHLHLQRQLWEELGLRYIQHHELRNLAIKKIEDEPF